jgi:hypothetical protein
VPEGVLFDTKKEYIRIRKLLVEQSNVIAVIRLHRFVFKPYTGQPTSIIVFRKGEKTKKVWFFDVQQDGYEKTGGKKGRRKINDDDLILLRQLWNDKLDTNKSFSKPVDNIVKNNYQLSLGSYLKSNLIRKTIRLKELVKDKNIIIGFTPKKNDDSYWFGGKNIWVKIGDITDEMNIYDSSEKITDLGIKPKKLLPEDSLLFSFKLSIGKTAITKVPLYTNEAIAGLIVQNPIIRRYLYYILPTLDYETNRATKGETLNKDSVGNLEIPFEEDKINSIVKKLDMIEKKRQKHIKAKEKLKKEQLRILYENDH